MVRTRWLIYTTLAFLLLAPQAQAGPPDNDDRTDAIVVPGVPFSHAMSTTEATADKSDPNCFGTTRSVWYSFTPDTDLRVQMDTAGSDHSPVLCVFTYGPLTPVTSSPFFETEVTFDAVAGQTYFVMIGTSAGDPGGNLIFNVSEGSPPPIDIAVVGGDFDSKTGEANLSLTTSCADSKQIQVFGSLEQVAGPFSVLGNLFSIRECNENVDEWSMLVQPTGGAFKGGHATVHVVACTDFPDCVLFDQVIVLGGNDKP